MQNLENVKKVSLVFFLVIGAGHLLSFLMIINGLSVKGAEIVSKVLFLPFLATGLIYGLSSLRLMFFPSNESHKILDLLFSVLTAIIVLSALVLTIIF